jgi:pimeloyl-ACP methyl ester carboxylesterase
MRRPSAVVLAATMVLAMIAGPASADTGPDYYVDETKLPFDAVPGFEDATRLWGVHIGAGYRIEVPADWNGDLVMWAHGFRGTELELTVDNHPLRELLLANGYAWAASSYSKNDYNVSVAVLDTRRLGRLFERTIGKPDLTYITGASMGGHVTAASIERYPRAYDGAMPICGVLGDYKLFDYFLDFNVAAQQLGLGTSSFPITDAAGYLGGSVPQIKANLEAAPGGWPVALNESGEQFKQLVELRSGGDRPNFDEAWYFWNTIPSFASGPGNFLFDVAIGDGGVAGGPAPAADNTETVYQFDLDPALSPEETAFNAEVIRVEANPEARKTRGRSVAPVLDGDITVPVLSLHNLGDLFVPFHNQIVYAEKVAEERRSHLLVQRAIRGVGHCDFTGVELATAFSELVAWVEFGIKPEGDDVLDPAVVAGADYGCRFTDFASGTHVLATPCP